MTANEILFDSNARTQLASGKDGAKLVAAGANPMDIERGVEAAVHAVVRELGRQSVVTQGMQFDRGYLSPFFAKRAEDEPRAHQ